MGLAICDSDVPGDDDDDNDDDGDNGGGDNNDDDDSTSVYCFDPVVLMFFSYFR